MKQSQQPRNCMNMNVAFNENVAKGDLVIASENSTILTSTIYDYLISVDLHQSSIDKKVITN